MNKSAEAVSGLTMGMYSTKYLTAMLIVLLVIIWSAVYLISVREEQNAHNLTSRQSEHLADFFENHAASTFRYADDYIKTVRQVYRQSGSFSAVRKYMAEIPPNTAILSHITIMNSNGVPQFISTGQTEKKIKPDSHARDRDYFKFQKSSKADNVYISTARKGRNTGLVTVRTVRRITNSEGDFDGLIFAAVKATQLLSFFKTTRLGPNTSATLVGLDKIIRLRRSQKGLDGIGNKIEKSKLWAQLANSESGFYRQTSIVDNVPRLWTYRKIPGFPVVAVIGSAFSDTHASLADIRNFRYTVAMLVSLVGIILVLLARRAIITVKLETEIKERRHAEIELLEAKEDAENASKAKSEFLAEMSHDLRTPLNAILGFSDMMRQKIFGPLGDKHYEDYADDIHSSGSLLLSLIDDVLDLSKIEAGKYELLDEAINIEALVNNCIRQFSSLVGTSKLKFTIDIAPNLPHMIGDERVIIQILNNLLSNAAKFTPDGGTISAEVTLDQDYQIIIKIKDPGIGMSDEDIRKAMKPFEQADNDHSRRHEGTGLGLHISATFMKLFGGSLQIESMVGMGTIVSLCFPPERTIPPS